MSAYGWGIDGYGRAHICLANGRDTLLCMLPQYGGMIGVWMLEDQDAAGITD